MDITCIQMGRGLVYLPVSARLVQPPASGIAAVDYAGGELLRRGTRRRLGSHGKPEIVNTDQGSEFIGSAFTGVLTKHSIAISMDGKGAWWDNVFVERLWRTIKYEEVYLGAYESASDARTSIGAICTSTTAHHNTHLSM
jgi:putative transposase